MNGQAMASPQDKRITQWVLLAALLVLLALVLVNSFYYWRNHYEINQVSGVWIGMALDLKEGVFYRPLLSERGYGGTRYFPLYMVLYTLLLRLGAPLLSAGMALSAAGALLTGAGMFFCLRRLGADRLIAACGGLLLIVSTAFQAALYSIHPDSLAVAFNLLGLALCLGPAPRRIALAGAAFLFTLAFATKFTAVYGVGAVFLSLCLARRQREALLLAGLTALGMLAVLAGMYVASDGRVYDIFRACLSSGSSWRTVLLGPIIFLSRTQNDDPAVFLVLVVGAAALFLMGKKEVFGVSPIMFVLVLALTAPLFGSPGISTNHLVEVHAVGVLLVMTWLVSAKWATIRVVSALLLVLVATSIPPPLWSMQYFLTHQISLKSKYDLVLKGIEGRKGLILSEDATMPALAGQAPFMMDTFMFRVISKRDPSYENRLAEKILQGAFSVIVLRAHSEDSIEEFRQKYGEIAAEAFQKSYIFFEKIPFFTGIVLGQKRTGHYHIYLPRAANEDSGNKPGLSSAEN